MGYQMVMTKKKSFKVLHSLCEVTIYHLHIINIPSSSLHPSASAADHQDLCYHSLPSPQTPSAHTITHIFSEHLYKVDYNIQHQVNENLSKTFLLILYRATALG